MLTFFGMPCKKLIVEKNSNEEHTNSVVFSSEVCNLKQTQDKKTDSKIETNDNFMFMSKYFSGRKEIGYV